MTRHCGVRRQGGGSSGEQPLVPALHPAGDRRFAGLQPRPCRRRMRLSAGVVISATIIDTSTASAYDMASGRKNAPVRPERKKTGSSASASISEAYTTAPRTSSDASKITRAVERPSGSLRCCRSRRTMFSVSTIASSTTAPSAITNPPAPSC